jgi:anaerobic magnesium-protoporphyrin IX monomethyl ester cyclase
MTAKLALLFVPGWTLTTGSPHLAIPLLRGFLEKNGIEVISRDLNFEIASKLAVKIEESDVVKACESLTLESFNEPYFKAEDHLVKVSSLYEGSWNAQLGFWYNDFPEKSSIRSLAAIIRPSPFDHFYKTSVVPELLKENLDIIGLCIASVYQIIPALQLAKHLRDAGYTGLIILGGNTISRLAKEMAIPSVFDLVDGLIKFQGEIPLLQLCKKIKDKNFLETIPQLIWRNSDNQIVENDHIFSLNPNEAAPPNYDNLAVGKYWGKNYINLVAARGCYYGKCHFCPIPYGWGENGFAGLRSPERTFQDITGLLEKHGINRFKFVDEALSPAFMKSLSQIIIDSGVEIEWEGYVRLETAWYRPDFLKLISRAGFRKGYFGLELISSTTRDFLGKQDSSNPDLLVKLCGENRIKIHFFCMFGYPGTGQMEAEETVEFLLSHQKLIDTVDIFPWSLLKHTTVQQVTPIFLDSEDWSLEFRYESQDVNILDTNTVQELATHYEEIIWSEIPRYLHPTYRLGSPWSL